MSAPLTKLMECRGGCSRDIEVNVQTVNPPRCFECGINAAVDAMRQMRTKSGPVYSRYVMGMRAYAEKIGRRSE